MRTRFVGTLNQCWCVLAGVAVLACALPAAAQMQTRLPATFVTAAEPSRVDRLPSPSREPEAVTSPAPLPPISGGSASDGTDTANSQVIDLPTAWRLADRVNPHIGISRQAIQESLAVQQGARVLLLPSITGGGNYHDHNGNLQRSRGAILDVPAQQALYFGGGARTLAAESVAYPAIRIFSHLGDAIFEPLAARQQVQVRNYDAGATTNSVLLSVSTRYMELMGAEAQLEVLRTSRNNALDVARMTSDFARVGQARQADADRMTTEARLIESDMQRAQEKIAVAAAELARLLNLDPSMRLQTIGGPIPVLVMVDPRCGLDQLLAVALRQRPEMAARSAQIAENETRYRQEKTRAWLPTISVGFSAGDFGGGSNLVSPAFGRFAGRTDFDAFAYWSAQNFGVGNVARWRQRRAETDEAIGHRARTLNLVRSEVAEAYAAASAQWQAVKIAEKRLVEAEAGFAEEFNRIRGGEGLPIELLDNLVRLITARQAMITAIVSYDVAQFRLFVALGQPPTLALQNAEIGEAVRGDRT